MSHRAPWVGIYTDWFALQHGTEPIRLIATAEGVLETRTTPIGRFCVQRPDLDAIACPEGVTLAIPRMPWDVLSTLITRFQAELPNECLANVYWNPDRAGFEVVYPPQHASLAAVTTEDATDPYDAARPRVLQIHSHGTFAARFSATDDVDEQATGCYGVIGQLDQPLPQMAFRVACGGRYVPILPNDLFA